MEPRRERCRGGDSGGCEWWQLRLAEPLQTWGCSAPSPPSPAPGDHQGGQGKACWSSSGAGGNKCIVSKLGSSNSFFSSTHGGVHPVNFFYSVLHCINRSGSLKCCCCKCINI